MVTPCGLTVRYHCFGRTCLHLQGCKKNTEVIL